MKILGIETSCDETALSVVEGRGKLPRPRFQILSHLVASQTTLHAPFGGVVPLLAKRAHGKNLIPLLEQTLKEAELLIKERARKHLTIAQATAVRQILQREPDLLNQFLQVIPQLQPPPLDLLAVTEGPGLEPALWVGINFARALALVWKKPVLPINHLEGHIVSVLADPLTERTIKFPALALLISGGHTELILVKDWLRYQMIGQTRDDAVGEAFDKVARILGLPYPGGPALERLAQSAKSYLPDGKAGKLKAKSYSLPRPMLHSPDFDFSFAGLKTAVFYLVQKITPLTNLARAEIAAEFQQAAIDVLLQKTLKAVKQYRPKTVIVGGGVSANEALREQLGTALQTLRPRITFYFPSPKLATDNATMIAVAAYLRCLRPEKKPKQQLTGAKGNLRLA